MLRNSTQLRTDALAIWQAGVDAVRGDVLIERCVNVKDDTLHVADERIVLADVRRIVVVGAGKAGGGMAAGLERALGARLMNEKQFTGWVNVPAGCERPLQHTTLFPARPAGVNEPTVTAVHGTERMLEMVSKLTSRDLCICLLSGGGSALLPAPVEAITLADKIAITKLLSGAGANIEQLNTVRKQLSRIKGGGLADACRAGRLISLIISDVLGDPLDVIASGPTVPSTTTAADALDVLQQFHAREAGIPERVFRYLEQAARHPGRPAGPADCHVSHHIVGNNAVAVDACGQEAERRGYAAALTSASAPEGEAERIGCHLARMARHMRANPGPDCLITGGEPTVNLIDSARRGLGGRNQQLALAALRELMAPAEERVANQPADSLQSMLILSGGTDGEDGPTDAAGALADAEIADRARAEGLDPDDFLRRNDAYHFFEPLGGLIKTGPTDTNVCDVRVVLCSR